MSMVVLSGEIFSSSHGIAGLLERVGYLTVSESMDLIPRTASVRNPNAILLDFGCDFERGASVCLDLRSGSYDGVLVVLLDSQFGSSVVPVLNAGADDCLFHPIDGDVLVARLRAASRRFTRRTQTVSGVRVAPNPLLVGDILGAGAVRLTRTEERLLMALRDADGGVVPNQRLCAAASPNAPLSRESLQVHVAHLRLKLGNEKWRLKNCRAMGYLLAPSKDC